MVVRYTKRSCSQCYTEYNGRISGLFKPVVQIYIFNFPSHSSLKKKEYDFETPLFHPVQSPQEILVSFICMNVLDSVRLDLLVLCETNRRLNMQ